MYWRYVALNRYVKEITGVLYGSRKDVLGQLQAKQLNVILIRLDLLAAIEMSFFSRRFSAKQMAVFFKDFGNMLETGLTLTHIFNTLREQTLDGRLSSLYIDMNKKLAQGEALSTCFTATGKFSDLVISVICAGEHSGQLPLTMRTLSDYYSALDDMKRRIWGVTVYPIFVVSVLLSSLVYMSVNVIPHIRDILPPSSLNNFVTLFMLGLAGFLQHFWYVILLLPLVVFVGIIYFKSLFNGKFDSFIFKIPYVGQILRDYEISVVFLSIWVLHKAGVTIDVTLRKVIDSNKTYTAKQLESCRKLLESGFSLSESIKNNPYFPRIIADTVRFGEEMGRYDEYFERIYRFYKDNFQSRLNIIIGLVQPALFVFSGFFLFLMIAAFIQPIYANLGNVTAATMK